MNVADRIELLTRRLLQDGYENNEVGARLAAIKLMVIAAPDHIARRTGDDHRIRQP